MSRIYRFSISNGNGRNRIETNGWKRNSSGDVFVRREWIDIQRLIRGDEWLCQIRRILVIVNLPLSPLFPLVSSTELRVSIINSPDRHLISLCKNTFVWEDQLWRKNLLGMNIKSNFSIIPNSSIDIFICRCHFVDLRIKNSSYD